MLSSQSSLAVRCLTHGELTKAKQVIEVSECSKYVCVADVCKRSKSVFIMFVSMGLFVPEPKLKTENAKKRT
jgi:hypothetical protein